MGLLSGVRKFVRQGLQSLRSGGRYPILLPHRRLTDSGLRTLERPPEPLEARRLEALRLCDGTRTLKRIARQVRLSRREILNWLDRDVLLLWRGSVPAQPPPAGDVRDIIVSPHPDDATLCLGGMMLSRPPGQVLVLDVFTRTAWTRFPTEIVSTDAIRDIRLAEERMMSRLSGAVLFDMQLPEALLREHELAGVFTDAPRPWDREVMTGMHSAVARLRARHPDARWYVPLAVGHHLDHRIVRDAALEALRNLGAARESIVFFEDLPYAQTLDGVPDFSNHLAGMTLRPRTIDIRRLWPWKLQLNRVYWSQFTTSQLQALGQYARRIGRGRAVERVWTM